MSFFGISALFLLYSSRIFKKTSKKQNIKYKLTLDKDKMLCYTNFVLLKVLRIYEAVRWAGMPLAAHLLKIFGRFLICLWI